MRVKELAAFIKERENIRVLKEKGLPRPWTNDPILATYRFCNVHREDDRVSRWLREAYYPHFVRDTQRNLDIWFAAVVARLLNNPGALTEVIDHIAPWSPRKFRRTLQARALAGNKVFNPAYIVSTNGKQMNKVDYITDIILNILWGDRERLRPSKKDTLFVYHQLLMGYDGLGSFMAAQVVADLKYLPPLNKARDWDTFAASGPGSRRGLNRVLGLRVDVPWKEVLWHDNLLNLRNQILPLLPFDLHAQDLQNCLCEFDKYERARLGEGKPKQLYRPQEN